jgi:hypothetical protein
VHVQRAARQKYGRRDLVERRTVRRVGLGVHHATPQSDWDQMSRASPNLHHDAHRHCQHQNSEHYLRRVEPAGGRLACHRNGHRAPRHLWHRLQNLDVPLRSLGMNRMNLRSTTVGRQDARHVGLHQDAGSGRCGDVA